MVGKSWAKTFGATIALGASKCSLSFLLTHPEIQLQPAHFKHTLLLCISMHRLNEFKWPKQCGVGHSQKLYPKTWVLVCSTKAFFFFSPQSTTSPSPMDSYGIHWNLLDSIGFHCLHPWILLNSTGFCWSLLESNGFQWDSEQSWIQLSHIKI